MAIPTDTPRLTIERLNPDGCVNLLCAIVSNCVDDWNAARTDLAKSTSRHHRERVDIDTAHLKSIERFFHSKWFAALTSLDGDTFLESLEARWEREHATMPRRFRRPILH